MMFPVCKAPGPHSSISEEFLHSTILRPKKPLGSWNLVNPLLSMNEAWMDECAARLQPLVDQYKTQTIHQTFAIEKFRDLIVTTRSCPRDKKNLFLKKNSISRNVKPVEVSILQQRFPLNRRGFHYTVEVSIIKERFPLYSRGFHYTVEVSTIH